jgi:ABC-type transport system involved in multi-copper enzyme maturation permease subunit
LHFYLLIGMAVTAVLSATTIASEKQSGTWQLLLTTPMSDWHILLVKAAGVIYRARLFWALLFGHVLFFTLFGMIHPIAVLHLVILFFWVNALLLGAGMYMGIRLRVAGHAVIANCALALGLWVILPTMLSLASSIGGPKSQIRPLRQLQATYQHINPIVQGWVLTEGAAGPFSADRNRGLEYHWPRIPEHERNGSVWQATQVVFWSILIYGVAAAILAWRAVRNFRRLSV